MKSFNQSQWEKNYSRYQSMALIRLVGLNRIVFVTITGGNVLVKGSLTALNGVESGCP